MSTVPKSTSNSSIPADSSVSDKYKKFVAEKKQRCAELASGYTAEKRMLEKIMISIFLVLFFFSLFQIFTVAWLSAGKDTVSHKTKKHVPPILSPHQQTHLLSNGCPSIHGHATKILCN
mmetsp:Transcript_3897/g.14721  ORF Transcript_3897/g.14721 Transcript_3897/m.14721 type:complete len:119 (+) Transcript_3897:192-548(+)